jgi:hypothetical protein
MLRGMRSVLGTLLLAAVAASAQSPNPRPADSRWQPFQFLVGKWTGAGTGQPGAGQGAFSFEPDLDRQILMRRGYNQLASGPRHEDLMIVYFDGPNSPPRAIYFDSEGHTIHYNVTFPGSNAAVLESDGTQPGPKFRLSYTLDGKNLNGKFEVANPGSDYKTYLTWMTVREK